MKITSSSHLVPDHLCNARGCFREEADGSSLWRLKQDISEHATELNFG